MPKTKEKRKCIIDDGFRSDLVNGATFQGIFEIPELPKPKEMIIPKNIIPVTSMKYTKNHSEFVGFYVHDIKFSDVLTSTDDYLDELSKFPGVISPDCSLYRDMPLCLQIANTYMNRAVAHHLQSKGLYVIPNVRWGDERSYTRCLFPEPFAFTGIPKHSIVSIGSYGCIYSSEDKKYFYAGLKAMLDELEPKIVIVYGSDSPKIFEPFKSRCKFVFYKDWMSQKKGVK